MTPREKVLASAVGGLAAIIGIAYAANSLMKAFDTRRQAIVKQKETLSDTQFRIEQGAKAAAELADFRSRSLPSEVDMAIDQYQAWLLELVKKNEFKQPGVDHSGNLTVRTTDQSVFYEQHQFNVSGRGSPVQVTQFLHGLQGKNYLHRCRNFTLRQTEKPGELSLSMTIDALALASAEANQSPPSVAHPRGQRDLPTILQLVSNRNMFAPQNHPPKYSGGKSVSGTSGKPIEHRFVFEDTDPGQKVSISLADGAPEGASVDAGTGALSWTPGKAGDYELKVIGTDDGLPARTVEQFVSVTVSDPPKEEPKAAPVEFDEAKQAILTALIRSNDQWVAWISIRTKGKVLKVTAGDKVEVGPWKGQVVDVTQRLLEIEVDGKRWTLTPGQSLADGKKNSEES
jgi:hypothetical protein